MLYDDINRAVAFVDNYYKGLLSLSEFAAARGVDESAIRHAIKDGRLKPGVDCLKFGKQWVLSPHAWLAMDGNYHYYSNIVTACHKAIAAANDKTGAEKHTIP